MLLNRTYILSCLVACAVAGSSYAQVQNLRITEVDPDADEVEVTNTGGTFFTVAERPFCYRFNYAASITTSTSFSAGAAIVFSTFFLDNNDSDIFLYLSAPFSTAANIVHGVKYGPQANVGRAGLASTVGLWPSGSAFAPAPPVGTTLAYDGFGFHPADWYVDETPSMGSADTTTPSTVASGLATPSGSQDFESVQLGDEVIAITNWVDVNSSLTAGMFTVRCVSDVLSSTMPRGASTRWLRIRDQDASDVQNRFYTNSLTTAFDPLYRWTFWVNLEATPPGGAVAKPRIVIQHFDAPFANAWGVEFTSAGANLIVEGIGGTPASLPLYALSSPTGIGDWVKILLEADTVSNTVSASVNDGTPVVLPTSLSGTADKRQFRLCYRGEGTGNINTMLLDDVSVETDDATDSVSPIPGQHALRATVPNPFNPTTVIHFDVHAPGQVHMDVFDVAGHRVRALLRERRPAGRHRVVWDGRDDFGKTLASGAYVVQYRIGGFSESRKVTLVR